MAVDHLTAVSLFSGCGGFDWGATQAGVEIIWANDIDRQAAAAYRKLFPNVDFVEGDIQQVKQFPRADIMIGCYPCTGFSLGARRRWRERERDLSENDRNFLYREFLRALRQVQPEYLFVENVKGMASAKAGWFLQRQLDGFRRHGYDVQAVPLNTADYGVPQTRRRLFIAGVRRRTGALQYEFPKPTHGPLGTRPYLVLRDAIGDMAEWPDGEFFDYPFHGHYLTRNRKRGWQEPSYTIVADAHHVPLHPIGEPMKFVEKDRWALQGTRNRRLSWRECAAVQGLEPDAFTSGSLAAKHRVIGNAVPPAVAKALIEPIVAFESSRRGWAGGGPRLDMLYRVPR
ncbi:DNA cytosine methyltransferase [Planctomycetota bacterium]